VEKSDSTSLINTTKYFIFVVLLCRDQLGQYVFLHARMTSS